MTTTRAAAPRPAEKNALPLVVTDGQGAAQFRITQVQILNWGAYAGLQTMTVARSGIAIVGPSGRGKSTLLDAMASVILPNPQEFNQAARDDRGKKRERTVYSYARGHTDQRQDENRRSATTNYLRPPGGPGFPSGTAITWETRDGRRATAFRLAWVGTDADGLEAISSATVYGFVNDHFDLVQLNGITAVRQGGSPLSKASLERLVDLSRGDIIDASQARVHAKMRTVMGMGSTDESQRLAMQLLRRAQASKGIFSINALFKDFVLTEPLALTRWDVALEAYREASRLYDEFEAARRRTETLAPLPGIAEKYRAAGADYVAKNRLLSGDGPTRIHVWHAEKVTEWAETAIDDNRLTKAEVDEKHADAVKAAEAADRREKDTIAQLTAAGGDRSEALGIRLEQARVALKQIGAERQRFEGRLAVYGLTLPTSSGDTTLTHASLDDLTAEESQTLAEAEESAGKAAARLWRLRDEAEAKGREIAGLRARRSLIPEDADTRRNGIASALDIDIDRLRYAGELLQLKPEQRQWEKAVVGLLLPLSSTLLVDSHDFTRVRQYVHDNDMRGSVTIAPAASASPRPATMDGGVPALLDISDHPFQGWLAGELNETANYFCVETEAELDNQRPAWARGSITPAGMRTGSRDRFTKDDRRLRYPWIGWDTRRLLQELDEELESIQSELQVADASANEANLRRESARARLAELKTLRTELTWDRIDTSAAQEQMGELEAQLAQANSPQVTQRGVLVQIDDDARTIERGLDPINDVLRHVRFRQDATLSIESVERPSSDLKDFRQIITRYTSNTVGMDIEREADQVETSFIRLRKQLARLDDQSRAGDAWRRRVFDAREHVEFQAIETRLDGVKVIHDGVSGMSGGEGQELIAFILGAALRFRLGEGHEGPPSYASIILDEGFVKADSDYTGRSLSALRALSFQLIVGAPREKATAFEDYMESVAYININADNPTRVRIYPMTMKEALRLENEQG